MQKHPQQARNQAYSILDTTPTPESSDSNNNNNNINNNGEILTPIQPATSTRTTKYRDMEPLQIESPYYSDDGRPMHPYKDNGVHDNNENTDERRKYNNTNDNDESYLEDGEAILYPIGGKHYSTSTGGDRDSSSSWMSPEWEDYLYPPNTPIPCQLLRRENIAIPACYLLVGLLQGLSSVAVNVMPLDLGASEAQQTTVSSIRSLPSSFKLLFGFLSDILPIAGYRRKPYMLLGWLIASLAMLSLAMGSNLNIPARNTGCFQSDEDAENNNNNAAVPDDAPTIPYLSACLLVFGIGFWMADVMGDSLVAEKAKLELEDQRGSIQSTCYACRFFGMMVAAPASTALYSIYGPAAVIRVLAFLPLTILPLIYTLAEHRYATVPTPREQCGEIWNTVCSRAVWQPMGFVYLYNVMQVGNAAWKEYLVTVHNFTSCQLNILLIISFVLLYFGILAYKYYFIQWSWRKVYITTTILNGIFSSLQILLIYGITFGLSPFLFTLGDDAFAEFIAGIQFLPTTIMMVHLCPAGSEGASYAMFTTVNNSALIMSSAISTLLLGIWRVCKEALADGYIQGMLNLSWLTTASQVSAIIFVGLLPRYKEDLVRLGHSAKSSVGGFLFLLITFSTIFYAVLIGVLNIVNPGWMNGAESDNGDDVVVDPTQCKAN